MRLFLAGVVVTTGLSGRDVSARHYNYQDIPVGERSFGMGTASMAVNGDTGNMFMNPSVLSLATHSQFSASLSAFSRIDTRTGQYVSLFKSAEDNISRSGFLAIPSLVGGHVKSGSWTWGGTILVPFSFSSSGVVEIDDTHIGNFESKDESFWLGMFASKDVSENTSCGASVFYTSRTNSEKFTFITRQSPYRIRAFTNGFGVGGIVVLPGCTYKVNESVKIGVSFRFPPFLLGGEAYVVDVASDSIEWKKPKVPIAFYPLPWRLSFGIAWQQNPRLLWALDGHIYSSLKGYLGDESTKELNVSAKSIANFAFGMEYMAWKDFGVRAGFLTNFSSATITPANLTAINDKVNMFGGTLAFVWSQENGTISLGGSVQGGQGRAPEIAEEPKKEVPRSDYIYGIAVGSSTRF